MRIRGTKPEFWRSERISSVDWDARLVLKGLESYVDDNGVGKDDIALIVGDLFSRDLIREPSRTLARVSEAISSLHRAGLVHRYEHEGTRLLYISFWETVQRIDKPAAGRLPRPDGTLHYKDSEIRESVATPREPSRALAPGTEEQGNRGTGEQALLSDESDDDDPDLFQEFYDAYPRKEAKRKAEQAYRAAIKRADHDTIMAGLSRFPFADDRKFVPLPASWLNADRWADEASNVRSLRPNDPHAGMTRQVQVKETGRWREVYDDEFLGGIHTEWRPAL